ncbi:hypothetical protein KUC3_05060 [Alteromonas sp. KC3]|nr:hypothetical protein KUC3_05060 [Alteromonas sp. KC3]
MGSVASLQILAHVLLPLSGVLGFIVRLLVIAILAVVLFFPLYWLFYFITGQEWTAWIAGVLVWIVFPIIMLKIWEPEWRGRLVRILNYAIATMLLVLSAIYLYQSYSASESLSGPIGFFVFFGLPSIYYLFKGKFHINLKGGDET